MSPKHDNKFSVVIKGGSLTPADSVTKSPRLSKVWKNTFSDAYTTANQNRTIISNVFRWAKLREWKLTPPTDIDREDNN